MGEIIYRELMMTKFIDPGLWTYTMDRSKTEGKNIDTFEKAKAIIDADYASELVYTLEEVDDKIYMVSEQPIPCRNCSR